ncbi:TIGR04222 domain-containing membrane protein [Burkholderia sp. Ac-20353]|uniref:TIGR04222 domain-containing membrane protein n=1 Tax=Burkholderia sp. Ac-20353 TaxID=2703894 RepID=UPI00197BC854|nr:TIGR04222 domain-containing membrane protein [Burkholderia sp. Ac-20353]MBN3790854.1 TIGR04222 domain-containing membrane protein [Burkholderia sp. Ac-20353]
MAPFPPSPAAAGACELTEPQQALLARLQAYSPDNLDAPLPFSRRLADTEHWSHAHALAVVDEYKRFAFLAQVAGHPVTPSLAVDAAWHLHLQYTLEYWDVFCADVLRAPLHHMPGTGAPDEAAVYARHYRQTLDSYRRWFGCEPPESIWPRPAGERPDTQTQRAETHPSVPPALPLSTLSSRSDDRPSWWRRPKKFAWPAALAGVAATCASASDFNVLNYTGPQFLAFYIPFCIGALLLIVGLQRIEYRRRTWGTRDREASPDLNTEEAAYLTGGAARMAQVTTLTLVDAGAIRLWASKRSGSRVCSGDPEQAGRYADDWEWLHAQPDHEASYGAFRQRLAQREPEYADALRKKGWLWAPGEMRAARMAARAIALLVLGTGVTKFAVALTRGRPVLLLVISMVVFGFACRIVTRRLTGFGRGGATYGGQAWLDAHRDERRGDRDAPDDMLWTAALFGADALAGTAWAVRSSALLVPSTVSLGAAARTGGGSGGMGSSCSSDSGSSGGSSSSCSSSSCSSSSCGGCSSN